MESPGIHQYLKGNRVNKVTNVITKYIERGMRRGGGDGKEEKEVSECEIFLSRVTVKEGTILMTGDQIKYDLA